MSADCLQSFLTEKMIDQNDNLTTSTFESTVNEMFFLCLDMAFNVPCNQQMDKCCFKSTSNL